MEKTIVKKTGEFKVVKKGPYAQISVNCEIYNKKAEMIFQDAWNHENVGTLNWKFITGDDVIDSQTKIQKDFEMFKLLDIEVDNMEIIDEARKFFVELEEKIKAKEKEEAKIKRAEHYDSCFFTRQLKPTLEEKGYSVSLSRTKEDYVENGYSFELFVETEDSKFIIGHDFKDNIEIRNTKNLEDRKRIIKTTRSEKVEKVIKILEEVIKEEKNIIELIKEKNKKLKGAKQTLESTLGIEVECKKEWHSSSYNRRGEGYYTEHFIDKKYSENGYYSGIRFTESSKTVNGKTVKGFSISHLPIITDMEKLKKIYELLKEE